ncbi:hypothetical protein J4410_06600 [Candidatus Woesearchaeota archaeon]|nr:hypothetical protein [Candidatus Woesearchaeota archaeon]
MENLWKVVQRWYILSKFRRLQKQQEDRLQELQEEIPFRELSTHYELARVKQV